MTKRKGSLDSICRTKQLRPVDELADVPLTDRERLQRITDEVRRRLGYAARTKKTPLIAHGDW